MPTLLRIDSAASSGDASVTRRLTGEFVRQWQAAHPSGKVIARDLARTVIAPLTEEWIVAAYLPESQRSPRQAAVLAPSDALIAELFEADEYVFGVPMYNLSIP